MPGFDDLLIGRVLDGRYRLDELIGRGAMGSVYRATDTRLERTIAVKVMAIPCEDESVQGRHRRRFMREAQSAARLRHPNIVVVHDYGTDPATDLDYLVMELLPGHDLAVRLRQTGPLPAADALRILQQAADGLAEGHRQGIIHRDVKPGNLFLETGRDGRPPAVKLLDFGIALPTAPDGTLTHLTVFGQSPATPSFASPEQLRGDSTLTPASDIFSLGVVAYQMFAGVRPYEPEAVESLRRGERIAVPPLHAVVPDLSPGLSALVERALRPVASDRFATAGELADAVRSLRLARISSRLMKSGESPSLSDTAEGVVQRSGRAVQDRQEIGGSGTGTVALVTEATGTAYAPPTPAPSVPSVAAAIAPPPGPEASPTRIDRRSAPVARPATKPAKAGKRRRRRPGLILFLLILLGALAFSVVSADDMIGRYGNDVRDLLFPRADWLVILGTYAHDDRDDAEDRLADLRREGLSGAQIIDTDHFSGLRDGYWSVVLGPLARDEAAATADRLTGQGWIDTYAKPADSPGNDGPDISGAYQGTIGENSRLRMFLRGDGGRIEGHYYYTRYRLPASVSGFVGPNGELRLRGSYEGELIDEFIGEIREDGTIRGRWTGPDGRRTQSFVLRPDL